MKVIKRINNNAVLCIDDDASQVIALGRGVSQVTLGAELDLDLVDRTFYDVEPRYIDLMRDLPADCMELAASVADAARSLLAYELSPNIDIALADHIAFAIRRFKEHIFVQAPLAFDIQQNYPLEFKIAEFAIKRIKAEMGIALPRSETSGIALSIINGAYTAASASASCGPDKDALVERAADIIEESMGVQLDREGFGFARFATHLRYLLQRVETGESISSENSGMYAALAEANEAAAACVEAIAALISDAYSQDLTEEERLYLILHLNRICVRRES